MDIEHVIGRIGTMQEHATVKIAFGEPQEVRGRTIIPVARVRYGFGMGAGRGDAQEHRSGSGGGGGGGVSVRPLAIIEVSDERTAVTSIVDVTRLALAGMALAAWSVFWIGLAVRRSGRARA
jgi:uncharacterized spore protein YtfJ